MKTIFKITTVFNFLIIALLFFGAVSGDNVLYIGKYANVKDNGTTISINSSDTAKMTLDRLSGNATFPHGTLTAGTIYVNPSVGVAELFYVQGDSRFSGNVNIQSGQYNELPLQSLVSHPSLTSGQSALYQKGKFIVFAYNDGGTMKYRYINFTGTDAVWVYSTTAP